MSAEIYCLFFLVVNFWSASNQTKQYFSFTDTYLKNYVFLFCAQQKERKNGVYFFRLYSVVLSSLHIPIFFYDHYVIINQLKLLFFSQNVFTSSLKKNQSSILSPFSFYLFFYYRFHISSLTLNIPLSVSKFSCLFFSLLCFFLFCVLKIVSLYV